MPSVTKETAATRTIQRVFSCFGILPKAPVGTEALVQAALTLLTRVQRWSVLKAWGMAVAKRRGLRRAIVAVARKLAIVMHRIWVDGTTFTWSRETAASA
jgi:hypothetical protein